MSATLTAAQSVLADRLGRFFEENGLPRMAGRVLGHLLTCNPPEQTFEELVAAVSASRSTVSVVARLLVRLRLVERFGAMGERRDRYRLRDDAWTSLLEQDIAAASALRSVAADGLRDVGKTSASARGRLRRMRDFFVFLEKSYAPLLSRWQRSARRAR